MEIAGIIIAFVLMSMAKKLKNDPIQANYNKTKGFRIAELVLSVINTVCTVIMGIFSIVFAVLAMQINEAGYNGYEFSREFEEAFEEFAELGMDGITIFNMYAVIFYVSTALCLVAAILGFVSVGKASKAMSAYAAANRPVQVNNVQTYAQPVQYAQTPAQPYSAPVQQAVPVAPVAPAPAPAPAASKFCTTCGNVLESGAKFCPRCGSAQE